MADPKWQYLGQHNVNMFGCCFVACLVISLTEAASVGIVNGDVRDFCTSEIYCQGELLKTLQLAQLYNDSKHFVDLQQLNDPQVTLSNFNKLMQETDGNPNRTELRLFLDENFSETDELEAWLPPDWRENPSALLRIEDPNYKKWALELNALWKTLARRIKAEVAEHPQRHSLIYVENGFIIPGGRFKEFYYWDSYWVIEGLLLSGMHLTVRGMLENFLSMVQEYGFVPNGGRVYYLMRSQPPLLIPMVQRYLEYTQDFEFLEKNIKTLEREFLFWQRERFVDVEKDGKTYKLARYFVSSNGPRPESFREDYELGQKFSSDRLKAFYDEIKTAAESGWDFSARWFIDENAGIGNLSMISTRNIIPVELNAFLQRNARVLSEWQLQLNNPGKSGVYAEQAKIHQNAIDIVLWNEERGVWLDYDMLRKHSRDRFYSTNLSPLWTDSYDISKAQTLAKNAVDYLKSEGILDLFGGTPASMDQTGEQWDFPNAWPPLQSILVGGLYRTGWEPAVSTARELATRWLQANYEGYSRYQEMFEKYDAVNVGQFGGGGEYTVQAGFGWTNGVVLEFLNMFSSSVSSKNKTVATREADDCVDETTNHNR